MLARASAEVYNAVLSLSLALSIELRSCSTAEICSFLFSIALGIVSRGLEENGMLSTDGPDRKR